MRTQEIKESLVNPFIPYVATLRLVTALTHDIKLFNCEIDDPAISDNFDYKPGQFAFVSAFGEGEAPFGIVSHASLRDGVEFATARVAPV